MELSNRIVEYRARHRLTQRDFSKLAGISEPTLAKAENGQHIGKIATAKIIIAMEEKENV